MNVRDVYNKKSCNLKNKLSCFNQENNSSHGENVNIIIVTRKRLKNRKKQNVFVHAQQPRVASRLSKFSKYKKQGSITRHSSMPELNENTKPNPSRNRSGHRSDTKPNKYKLSPFYSKFIVNVLSEHRFDKSLNPFYYPRQNKFKIYRCEVGGAEDNCCCSCNSDAMFEIMRGLYECYKKRDCRNCKCILCSHLPKDKLKFSEKEMILREKAMKGVPLPEGITPSDVRVINKVRTDLGVPVEPKTKEIRDKHEEAAKAGKLLPLEGKTPAEKEKILKDLFDMGIPLPKGRTPSEKALIFKISGIAPSDVISMATSPSEQQRRAKAEGLMTSLKGKSAIQREKILKGLAMKGLPLPEPQSPSEKSIIKKVRTELGVPVEPKTKAIRDKHEKASKAGKLLPLEGKSPAKKEKILRGLHDMDIPLPVGRTPSEKTLIAKIAASPRRPSKASSVAFSPSEQMRQAKAEGLLTPLKGKSPEQKEKILKGLAMKGLPLPEAQSTSEKKLIDKVRTDVGLPKDPTTKSMKEKYEQAAKVGLLQPLEGKTPKQKEKTLKGLRNLGIPLPEGRTPSEKALIEKIKTSPRTVISPSEQLRLAKAEGLLTPLKGKPPEQKEKILKGLAMKGLPLPEAGSSSEQKIIDKVRADLGLPKDPTTKSMKEKHEQAAKAGLLQPLEGKTPEEKARVLKGLRDLGIPLPEGRTPSEKALIGKVKTSPRSIVALSEKLRRAKAEGLLTPLKGKSPAEKEKIVKGLAMKGLPLPEAGSSSEQQVIDKVRADLGLPKDPTTKSMKERHEQAAKAGLLQPLEGKTPAEKVKVLKGLRDMGIPLPEGRTPSEKALIEKVKASPRSLIAPSEQLRRAKAEGLLTPLKGKSPEEKEKIVKGLAMKGLLLPEAQSPSEQKVIDKVRADLGLPKDPTTKSMKEKYEEAAKAGLLQPLEGKTPEEKAKVLKGLRDMGIPLPEGRTPSEKALIGKVKESPRSIVALSEKLRRAKAEGLLTPLKGKTPEQKEKILKGLAMKGIPLPEGESPSEKKLIDKMRADLGLPKDPTTKSMKEKHEQAATAGLLQPLEGKTPAEKAKVLKGLRDMGIPLPEGRTPSEKALIAKVKASPRSVIAPSELLRRAKAEGLLTPLKGKSPEQKEKILKGLAMKGLPLPEAQSPSEKAIITKVRNDLGLPRAPTTKSMKEKHEQAAKAGLLQPLEGKTPAEKEKVLKGLRDLGIPLPDGRTPSEKALIAKVKASPRTIIAPSEQLRRAKAEGLLTPLEGKSPEEKEKIIKGLAMKGLLLPEAKTPSEKKLIDKVRADLGLPRDPTTKSMKNKHEQAAKAGLLQPLEGKTRAEKEKILNGLRDLGIPLPVGRTPSEKALIAKVKTSPHSSLAHSEQMRKAKAEGLLTPLKGKTPEEKEKILKGLAMIGLPLPEGQSPSEKNLINKVRADIGLPIEPTTKAIRDKHEKASKAGKLLPLEGKTPAEKEKILKGLHNMGIPLPVGRTPSEKSLIAKIAASPREPSKASSLRLSPSEQLRRAKAQGLLTSLQGKTPDQREKILKGLAMIGLPLPEGQSPSENKLIEKVRTDLGVPVEPKTKDIRDKHEEAAKAGKLLPLEGKTPAQKEKILKGLHDMGIPLPIGRTASEKALITKVMEGPAKKAAGIATEYEEIQKTTKCDRGCGCDKKKIRFKHSYVKIRVTSPDMTSLCDCPNDCLPGIKGGASVANDGIQVTVGSAVGVPSLTTEYNNRKPIEKSSSRKKHSYGHGHKSLKNSKYRLSSFKTSRHSNGEYYILNSSCSVLSSSTRPNSTESDNIYQQSRTAPYEGRTSKSDLNVKRCFQSLGATDQNDINSKTKSTASSNGSIVVLKSEMSLHSTISKNTMDTVSFMSIMDSSISPSSTHYSGYQSTDDLRSSSLDESTSNDLTNRFATIVKSKKFWNMGVAKPKREYTVLRMSQARLNFGYNEVRANKMNSKEDPVVLINRLPSKLDVSKILNKIISNKRFAGASSIFVVVPMSEDEEEHSSSNCVDSMTSIHSIESETILKDSSKVDPNLELTPSSCTKRDENICGKGRKFFMKEVSSNETETMCQNETVQVLQRIEMANGEVRQIRRLKEMPGLLGMAVRDVGTEVNTIKPCRCQPKKYSDPNVNEDGSSIKHCIANGISRQERTLSPQGCNHLSDMRRTSASSSDLRVKCGVITQTSVGCRIISRKATSCSRLPDMRTPSSVSLVQPWDKSGPVESNQLPTEKSGSNHLPDMRMPSEKSLIQLRDSSSAMKSRILPSNGCSRLPNMRKPSTGSLDQSRTMHSQASIESRLFPHKTTGYYRLPKMSSTVSPIVRCEAPSSSDFDWSSLILSGTYGCCYPRLIKTASTGSSEHLSDMAMFSYSQVSLNDFWSNSTRLGYGPRRPSKQNRCKETSMPHSVPCFSSREHKPPMCIKNRFSPIQPDLLRAETITPRKNRREPLSHTKKTKLRASTNKLKTDGTEQHRTNRQSCIPQDSLEEEDCLNEVIETTDFISIRDLRIQTSIKSKMPTDSAREEYCLCEDKESTNIITNNILKLPQPLQLSQKSKMPTDSAREEYCLCEDKESTNIITNNILKLPQPLQSSRKSKMPTESAREEYCLCEDIEYVVHQPSVNSVAKGNCECQEQLRNVTIKDCKCQQQAKDLAVKLNSEFQKHSNKSANKENSESKNFVDNDFCECEEVQARNRCTTGQVQHQARQSPKHSQISKLISSITKSVSHKIDKTMAPKVGEVKKKSKKKLKTKKVSKNPQSHHSIQTMLPDAPKGPEVIYDDPYECNCEWIDIEELKRLRSKLTATTSGFKVCKKRRRFRTNEIIFEKPQVEIELDFEDAIKYYVGKYPELFRDLIPQLESVQGNAIEEENKPKKTKKKGKDSFKELDEYGKI